MSRLFTGGSFNYITFGPGSAPTVQGPITLACLVKPATITGTHWWWTGRATSTHVWSILTDTSKLFIEGDFGTGGPSPTIANWWYVVVTKASGSALPRWHVKNVTTGGAWSHTNSSANVPNNTGPITNILFGGDGSNAGTNADMKGAAAATWGSVLSDLAIEAACTLNASDLKAATPSWMVRFNQASTATAVPDDTGGTGGQTAITGTAVDAEDPPGYSYTLTTTVTKDVSETYRVFNAITKNSSETYRVFNSVTKNNSETYRVLNAITNNRPETYRVFGAGTKDVTETYRVLNSLTKDVSETYRVFRSVTADKVETYRVFAALTKDLVENYRVLNVGTFDRAETYRVFNARTKDVSELYTILSATGAVKDVVESYRIFNSVTRDQAETYRVLNARLKDVAETYRVLNGRSIDLIERYNVFAGTPAVKNVVEAYQIFNARVLDVFERYNVGDVAPSTIVPDAVARLDVVAYAFLASVAVAANLGRSVTAYLDDVDD